MYKFNLRVDNNPVQIWKNIVDKVLNRDNYGDPWSSLNKFISNYNGKLCRDEACIYFDSEEDLIIFKLKLS